MIEADLKVKLARGLSAALRPSRKWRPMQLVGTGPDRATIWENNVYQATLRRYEQGWPLGGGPWARAGIWCPDGEARHDWRDFQRIKNDLVGPQWEAIELYPAEERLLDPSNYYSLFCAPEIRIGQYVGRVLANAKTCLAPQRPWGGDEPEDLGECLRLPEGFQI